MILEIKGNSLEDFAGLLLEMIDVQLTEVDIAA